MCEAISVYQCGTDLDTSSIAGVQAFIDSIINTPETIDLDFCAKVELIEAELNKFEQVDIPVTHVFAPGVYMRQIMIPKDTILISRYHKYDQIDIMVYGDMSIASQSGSFRIKGPFSGVSSPGLKRIGYAHEDTLWIDVHATDATDIEKLEADLFTDDYREISHLVDRTDYLDTLEEFNIPHEVALLQSRSQIDRISIHLESYELLISDSKRDGRGLFSSRNITPGEIIAPARIGNMRTQAGRYTNHSLTPNAKMVMRSDGDIDLVSIKNISAHTDEITVNYRQALSLLLGMADKGEQVCLA